MELKKAIHLVKIIRLKQATSDYIKIDKEDSEAINTVLEELNNSIPKSKLEFLREKLIKDGDYRTLDNPNGRVHFRKEDVDYKIELIDELLNKE